MQKKWLERTELLVKKEGIEKLQKSTVLVVGLGGVGSFAAEFLARAGIGNLSIVDGDVIDVTNINRQLPALHTTIGKLKAQLVEERLKEINPKINLTVISKFLSPTDAYEIVDNKYDYVLDCIDSIQPKVQLLIACKRKKVKTISAMGAGGKMDPSKVKVRDISKTRDCTLARVIKKELKKHKIHKGIRCVFSSEIQDKNSVFITDGSDFKKSFYGTISYMPAIFGLYAAAEVVQKITSQRNP